MCSLVQPSFLASACHCRRHLMRCHGATDICKPVRSNTTVNTITDSTSVMSTAMVTVDADVTASRKKAVISEKKSYTLLTQRRATGAAANPGGWVRAGYITFLRCVNGTVVVSSRVKNNITRA